MIFIDKKPLEQVLQEQRNKMLAKDVIKKLVRQAFEEALRIEDQDFQEAFKNGVRCSHFWENSEIKKELLSYLND